jgi:hypothetical protein
MNYLEQDVELFTDRLFQIFATSEEVLNHLNTRIEIAKQTDLDFEFDEFGNQFEFLNDVRKYVLNKSKFQ